MTFRRVITPTVLAFALAVPVAVPQISIVGTQRLPTNCTTGQLAQYSTTTKLWSCTSSPVFTSPEVTTLELGHATDTTLSRVSAGVLAVEGITVALLSGATFTGTVVAPKLGGITSAPSIAGNGTLVASSTDVQGKVLSTLTGAATITLTFGTAFTVAPSCTASNETTANLTRPTSTTTTLVITGTTVNADSISYVCIGR